MNTLKIGDKINAYLNPTDTIEPQNGNEYALRNSHKMDTNLYLKHI